MAIRKPTAPKPKPHVPTYKPADYLSGSQTVGQKYNAWNTYGGKKPDFGKGAGPGTPYHVVQKTVKKPSIKPTSNTPSYGKVVNMGQSGDARVDAIKRRLGVI